MCQQRLNSLSIIGIKSKVTNSINNDIIDTNICISKIMEIFCLIHIMYLNVDFINAFEQLFHLPNYSILKLFRKSLISEASLQL